jgi:aspartyl-tRNA(Asn)/glutamyl-tRNA(Gln) amidotransferase subunit A
MVGVESWQERVTGAIAQQALAGAQRTGAQYVADLDRLAAFRWRMLDAVAGFHAIATPSSSAVAWPRGDLYPEMIGGRRAGPRAAAVFSTAINLAGLPAIVVPAPLRPGGLPVGLQLIGSMGFEEGLLDLAAQFEKASPWPRLAPI